MNHGRKLVAHERNAQDGRFFVVFFCYCCVVVVFFLSVGAQHQTFFLFLWSSCLRMEGWIERGRRLLFLNRTSSQPPLFFLLATVGHAHLLSITPCEQRVSSLRFLHQRRLAETTVCGACVYSGRAACARVAIPSDCREAHGKFAPRAKPQALSIISGHFSFFKPIQKWDYRRGGVFFFSLLFLLCLVVVSSLFFFFPFDLGFPRWSRAGLLYVELSELGLS